MQRTATGLVLLLVVAIAGSTIAGPGPGPTESGQPSPTPDTTAPTVSAAVLTSELEEGGIKPPTQVDDLNGIVFDGPSVRTSTPEYAFRSDEAGTIVFGGSCRSVTTAAIAGLNTLTFNFLVPGTHNDCTVQVRDAAGNLSDVLHVKPFQVYPPPMSIARIWNEVLLSAIRVDRVRPPVVARNLFHTSAAMYDIWAAYDGKADTYLLGHPACPLTSPLPANRVQSERKAISYAMYRLISERYAASPGAVQTTELMNRLMNRLGYSTLYEGTDFSTGSAAALGNYVAQCYIAYGLADGSNEAGQHANTYYEPVNEPLIPAQPGTQIVADLDRWQPLALDVFVDQAGNVVIGGAPPFIGAEWGNVTPFALGPGDLTINYRDSNRDGALDEFKVYHDPGPPPSHLGPTADEYRWNFALVAKWSGQLDPRDGVMIDISPASQGNDPSNPVSLPTTFAEYQAFYHSSTGGDASRGHTVNPRTGAPYAAEVVPRGDFVRVLAEFWADGPNSETPPGHWFTILNYVASQLPPQAKRMGGGGPALDDLEWDVKSYFMLGGAMHDAAISSWSVKGWYDYVRPITAIRAMDRLGMTLEPGFIEKVQPGDPLAGENYIVGKIKILAWRGPTVINDPATEDAGVGWILAEDWWPYQRPSFVTPPFGGYVSGHSTFSRAGADVLTAITGDPYFPGGLGRFAVKKNEYLVFEDGPSQDITLEWATYRDASDQTSLSRIWGGIHPPFDDIPGRKIGTLVAAEAVALAERYFAGDVVP
jgi:Domain of unknown function (DUF6851)